MTRLSFPDGFVGNRRANVAAVFACYTLPLIFVIGMAIDYGAAARLRSKLNAAADAATLAATAPGMMTQSDANAASAATKMFNAEVTGLSRLIFDGANPADLSVAVSHPANNPATRNVTVTYAAQSQNIFGNFLKWNTIAFGGSASGSATMPPNMNFYLLIDTSPSMAIPADATSIQKMQTATQKWQNGCAFACHETDPELEQNSHNTLGLNNPGGEDNYALARSLGLPLRIDSIAGTPSAPGAAQNTVQYVINKINQNIANYGYSPLYQIAINTFDTGIHNLFPLTTASSATANLTQLQNVISGLAANPSPIQVQEVYDNNNDCRAFNSNGSCKTSSVSNDADTNINATLGAINDPNNIASYIPNAGSGYSPNPPAETLVIVTDGVEDDMVASVTAGSIDPYAPLRQQAPFAANSSTPSYALCQEIKARGIQIAILYTTYFALDAGNENPASWYDEFIYQFQRDGVDQIGASLQNNCASPGLFITVPVGGNISAGLANLIDLSVNTSHLTQ